MKSGVINANIVELLNKAIQIQLRKGNHTPLIEVVEYIETLENKVGQLHQENERLNDALKGAAVIVNQASQRNKK